MVAPWEQIGEDESKRREGSRMLCHYTVEGNERWYVCDEQGRVFVMADDWEFIASEDMTITSVRDEYWSGDRRNEWIRSQFPQDHPYGLESLFNSEK